MAMIGGDARIVFTRVSMGIGRWKILVGFC